jgi:hypothetical protein
MKKVIISMLAFCAIALQSFAQCSPTINGFEMKLIPLANRTLSIQIRCTEETTQTQNKQLPNQQLSLDGLIFAITWPNTSNIVIQNVVASNAPFMIAQDKSVGMVSNKTSVDQIATFYQASDLPVALKNNWIPNQWYPIATIKYSGDLAANDIISFVTCEYGVSHPNSYYGNSTTDPWLAFLNMQTNDYQQYSPKMITEMPNNISVSSINVYPNPSNDVFNVSINTPVVTQVALQLLDMKGQIVKTQIEQLQGGANVKTIDVQSLASGNYTIKISDGKSINHLQKVQKL